MNDFVDKEENYQQCSKKVKKRFIEKWNKKFKSTRTSSSCNCRFCFSSLFATLFLERHCRRKEKLKISSLRPLWRSWLGCEYEFSIDQWIWMTEWLTTKRLTAMIMIMAMMMMWIKYTKYPRLLLSKKKTWDNNNKILPLYYESLTIINDLPFFFYQNFCPPKKGIENCFISHFFSHFISRFGMIFFSLL